MEPKTVILQDLLSETRDGDWGEEIQSAGYMPYKVIRGTDFLSVRYGDLSSIPIRYLSESSRSRRTLQANDIIIETAGGSRERPTGRTLLVTGRLLADSDLPITCASFCRFLRVDPKLADPQYVYWYLQYLYEMGVMWQHQVQHTGLSRFQYTRFATTERIPVPDSFQQHAIVSILNTLDDKIELNRQMNKTLESIAQALFKSWFVDFDPVRARMEGRQPYGMDAETAALFPDSFEDSVLGEIPRGWRVKNLPEAMDVNPVRSLAKGQLAPYLEMSNMSTSSARALGWECREYTSGMKFINGDVLLARITPCLENGKTAYVDFLANGQVGWGSTEYIVLRCKPPLLLEYVYFLARSDGLRSYAIKNMTGTSGRQRVPAECFKSYSIVVPSEKVSEQFGEIARSVMAAIKQHDEESSTLSAIRDALLPKLLSGEIRVKDAEKFVEANA